MKYIILIPTFLFALSTHALSSLNIKTKWDQYQIKKAGSGYVLGNKKIDSPHLKPLLEVLSSKASGPCADEFTPQVTVIIDQKVKKQINLDTGVLKGPDGCLNIRGPGMDAFPIHRKWLVGLFKQSLPINKNLSLSSVSGNGFSPFAVVKSDEDWLLKEASPTFNYEFLNQFIRSLKDFKIDRFIHESALKDKPQVKLTTNGKSFHFYQLAPTTWALKDSSKPWAMVSPQWSNWKDLGKNQWTDPNSKEIALILSNDAPKAEKLKTLESLGNSWTESLKHLYQACIKRESEDTEVRLACLAKMKRRPTDNNFKAVFLMMEHTSEPGLLKEAANFLRIKNPKGPKFSPGTNITEFRMAWRSWWNKNQR